ncbi:MAG: type II toxin-antitoxin system Phd/YefM family antitoxin [Nevskiales bacterium]
MKFLTVRELRGKSAQVWRDLKESGELVITNNGRPVAIVTPTDERGLEESLRDLRQARALRAARQMQQASLAAGTNRLRTKEIEAEITGARRGRRS